jgi:hypothetical protein
MGYVLSIWDTVYRYGYLPHRYGRWDNDMGDDSVDVVVLHIDVGYPVTLVPTSPISMQRASSSMHSAFSTSRDRNAFRPS